MTTPPPRPPDMPRIDAPLTPEQALDDALIAHAAKSRALQMQHVEFGLYPDDPTVPAAYRGKAWWQLTWHGQQRSDGPPLPGNVLRFAQGVNQEGERLIIISTWRKAFFDERRPRPSDVAEARPATPSTRPGSEAS